MENIKKYWTYALLSLLGLIVLGIVITISVYFLYVIPKQASDKLAFEQLKWTQEQQEKTAKEKEKKEAAAAIEESKQLNEESRENCLATAQLTYSAEWDSYCVIWKAEVKDTYEDCKKRFTNIGYSLTEAKNTCWTSTPDYNETPDKTSCYLPNKYSTTVDNRLKELKDECYKKYPVK